MSEYINTLDELGDVAFTDALLEKTAVEVKDNVITRVGHGSLACGGPLRSIDLPSVTSAVGSAPFERSASLLYVNVPNLINTPDFAFRRCVNLERLKLPKVQTIGGSVFMECRSLSCLDFGEVTSLGASFEQCYRLEALIIRTSSVCVLTGLNFEDTPIASGRGYIYVPSNLIDEYKRSTNWSVYASQFRILEDYTTDGTSNGAFDYYHIKYTLVGVHSSNQNTQTGPSYSTTLSTDNPSGIGHVRIVMSGDDITADVYEPTTGIVNIQNIVGNIEIIAAVNRRELTTIYPYDGGETGLMKAYLVRDVPANTTFELIYFMSMDMGVLSGFSGNDGTHWTAVGDIIACHVLGRTTITTRTSPSYKTVANFSCDIWSNVGSDGFTSDITNALYGKYLTIAVLEG